MSVQISHETGNAYLFLVTVNHIHSSLNTRTWIRIVVDGTPVETFSLDLLTASMTESFVHAEALAISAGTHTVTLQWSHCSICSTNVQFTGRTLAVFALRTS